MADYRDYEFLAAPPLQWWIGANYCVTLVRNISSQDFLNAVGAQVLPVRAHGYEQVIAFDPPGVGLSDPLGQHVIGVADHPGGFVLVVEAGYMGVSTAVVGPVAAEHDAVSVYGTEGRYLLAVWAGGVLQISIDPKQQDKDSPWAGSDPGTFDSVWSTVSPKKSAGDRLSGMEISQSLFAALETFTGAHLSEEDFIDAEFSVATVPRMLPASESDYVRRLREVRWNARELA